MTETGENTYAGANVQFSGTYKRNEEGEVYNASISLKQALKLLEGLTMEETGLPADITEYTLLTDDMLLIIKDTVCYSIGAYADLGERLTLMNYYVTTDGSKI